MMTVSVSIPAILTLTAALAGLGGFYLPWTVEVVVVPCVLWSCVLLYYLSRVATVGQVEAAAKAYNDAFFVLFLAYPVITNKLFKMLDCRTLAANFEVRFDWIVSAFELRKLVLTS